MVRERLRIGDLAVVLSQQMNLPKFIRLDLSFRLDGMKFPISFPKQKRMYKVAKHLQQLSKTRQQLTSIAKDPSSQEQELIYVIIEGQKRPGYEHTKIDKQECCEQQ